MSLVASPSLRLPEATFDARSIADKDGIVRIDLPLAGGDYDDEQRQVERMRVRGRLPYGVNGITSMAQNQQVRFLPGAFTDSLAGEIVLLAGNNYDDVLAANAAVGGALRMRDTPEYLEFEAQRLPKTVYAEDFASKLRLGLVRGVTAGWAAAGSDTITESLPDGGSLVTVRKAMLCEIRLRTRTAFEGESIVARPRPVRRRYLAV